jgi:saccharopine dehydrogenase-like NADP-dependent oxidoreductase
MEKGKGMNIIVLGGGRVGTAVALDLERDGEYGVTVVDQSEKILEKLHEHHGIATLQVHLDDPRKVKRVVRRCDLVIGALPGSMGFATLQAVVAEGKNIVDSSFCPEDPFLLDSVAKEAKVTAVVDCGVAPGLSNMILGHHDAMMARVDRFECAVGGLPVERMPPWEYKASFSPADVIEVCTRPARFVEDGTPTTRPALSDAELIEFPSIGRLEAFNTDGLRTLLTTMSVPNMKEKTLRYPGHIQKMALLRDSGFFDSEPVKVGSAMVVPRELTSKLLFAHWELSHEDRDFTAMRVDVEGVEEAGQEPVRYRYELLDQYDEATNTTSMARTTGYTCSAVTRLIGNGTYEHHGISPPEFIGREAKCFESVMTDLAARGIVFDKTKSLVKGDEE